jgi:hypothetical protein
LKLQLEAIGDRFNKQLILVKLLLKYVSTVMASNKSSLVDKERQRGFINQRGKGVIPLRFEGAQDFSQGVAAAPKKAKWGFINEKGESAIPLKFDAFGSFDGKQAPARVNDKWGIIEVKGNRVIEPQFQDINRFNIQNLFGKTNDFIGNTFLVEAGDNYSWVDLTGKSMTGKSLFADPFWEGLADVYENGKWGCIDTNGTLGIKPQFELAGPFGEHPARVRSAGTYGCIGRSGEFTIHPRFKEAHESENGYAVVGSSGGFGATDRSGKFVIQIKFTSVEPLDCNGVARASIGDGLSPKWGYINRKGDWIWKP